MNKNTYISLLLAMLAITPASATAIITEAEATPSVISEPDARLLINEVNLKNPDADWVELYYSSPSSKPINLKGISFQDDSVFKKIDQDFLVQPNQYLILTFKSEQTDSAPYMYSGRTGLTGTTEQFIIRDRNNKVLDAVCWASTTPTASEIKEMQDLFDAGGWNSANPASCIGSEAIKTGQSIIRLDFMDTQSTTDWQVAEQITPAAANEIPEEEPPSTATTAESPAENVQSSETATEEIETDAPTTTSKSSTAKSTTQTEAKPTAAKTTKSKSAKSSTKKVQPTYSNGDDSSDIKISEIMPNPKADDNKNEWIELINSGEESVSLGNWQLDDDEKGSKPYTLSDETVIDPGATMLISIQDSKISLANKADKVRLYNFHGELMDEVAYSDAPEEQSYTLLQIKNQDAEQSQNWQWTKEITPGEPNPVYDEIKGIISKVADFGSTPYHFEMADEKGNSINVIFTETEIAAPLAKATFLKDAQLKIIAEQTKNSTFALKSFEIITPGKQEQDNSFVFPSILGTLFTAGGSAFYFVRKKMKV